MCAIIGAKVNSPSPKILSLLKRVFLESQIRGKHATGIAIRTEGELFVYSEPVPASEFVRDHWDKLPLERPFELIGHCRYSTSDLKYNQPMYFGEDLAIVHNGVVDQRPPEFWSEYGYKLATSNDSELVYRCVADYKEPLIEFPDASMAVCELGVDRPIRFYRNGKRPLWEVDIEEGFLVVSTFDIARRALPKDILGVPRLLTPGVIYTPTTEEKIKQTEDLIPWK